MQGAAVDVSVPVIGDAVRRQEGRLALHRRVVRSGQVRRSAPQLGKDGGQGGQHIARGGPGGHGRPDLEGRQSVGPPLREPLRREPVEQLRALRVGRAPRLKLLVPLRALGLGALGGAFAGVNEDFPGDVEGLLRIEAQSPLQAGELFRAELRAVGGPRSLLCGGGPGHDRRQADERGPVCDGLGVFDRLVEGLDVLLVLAAAVRPIDVLGVPAVRLVAPQDVLGEGDLRVVLD